MEWFNPLLKDHPLVGDLSTRCPVCKEPFKEGDVVGLIPVQEHGPESPHDLTVKAIPVHKNCYLPGE